MNMWYKDFHIWCPLLCAHLHVCSPELFIPNLPPLFSIFLPWPICQIIYHCHKPMYILSPGYFSFHTAWGSAYWKNFPSLLSFKTTLNGAIVYVQPIFILHSYSSIHPWAKLNLLPLLSPGKNIEWHESVVHHTCKVCLCPLSYSCTVMYVPIPSYNGLLLRPAYLMT